MNHNIIIENTAQGIVNREFDELERVFLDMVGKHTLMGIRIKIWNHILTTVDNCLEKSPVEEPPNAHPTRFLIATEVKERFYEQSDRVKLCLI